MHSSSRHLLLIIGSVLTIFGILLFFFLQQERTYMAIGGFLFVAGALLISRAIKNPQQRRNQLPDIRKRYKEQKKEQPSQKSDEVH